MPGRSFSSISYRYGFNGMEKDDEIKDVSGSSYDFGARMYDSRLGRWLSSDPHWAKYPDLSSYNFVGNSPLIFIDADGKDIYYVDGEGNSTKITLENYSTLPIGENIEILLATPSGSNVINNYLTSKTTDIYITIGATGEGAGGLTQMVGSGARNSVDGTTSLTKIESYSEGGSDGFNNFKNTDVSESNEKDIALIVLRNDIVSEKENDGSYGMKSLEGGEVLFHEIKAHVQLVEGSGVEEHNKYGSDRSISQMNPKTISPNKPAGIFLKELSESDLKMYDWIREDIKGKIDE